MKKLLSVLLAATTVVSLGGAAVYAKDTDMGDLKVYYDDASSVEGTNNNDTVTPDQKVLCEAV